MERAGAEFVILASNTLHVVSDLVQPSIQVPLLHIADAAAEEIKKCGITTVGLLGTRAVMEQDFYRQNFLAHGITSLVPGEKEKEFVHNLIYNELCLGKLLPESRENLRTIIRALQQAGAEAVVLGCTELPLLISSEDTPVKLFDTMTLHVKKAVNYALEERAPPGFIAGAARSRF